MIPITNELTCSVTPPPLTTSAALAAALLSDVALVLPPNPELDPVRPPNPVPALNRAEELTETGVDRPEDVESVRESERPVYRERREAKSATKEGGR